MSFIDVFLIEDGSHHREWPSAASEIHADVHGQLWRQRVDASGQPAGHIALQFSFGNLYRTNATQLQSDVLPQRQ